LQVAVDFPWPNPPLFRGRNIMEVWSKGKGKITLLCFPCVFVVNPA
jgi:hypothetical protein